MAITNLERVVAQQIIDMLQKKVDIYFGKEDTVGEILTRKISMYKRDTFRTLLNIYTIKYIYDKESMLVDYGREAYSQEEINNIKKLVNVYINGWISQWVIFRKHNPKVPIDNLTAKRSKVFPWIQYDENDWNKFQSYLTSMYHEAAKAYEENCVYHFLTEEEAAAERAKYPSVSFSEPDDILATLRTDILQRLDKTAENSGIDSELLDTSLRHIVNNIRGNKTTLDYEYSDYPEDQRQIIKDKHGQFIDYCYDQVLSDKGYLYGNNNENIDRAISDNDIPTVQDFQELMDIRASIEAYRGLYTEGENNSYTYTPKDLELVIEKNKELVDSVVIPDFTQKLEDNGKDYDYVSRTGRVQNIRIPSMNELTGIRDELFAAAGDIAIRALNTTKTLNLSDLQNFHAGIVKVSEDYQKEHGQIDPSFVGPIISAAEASIGNIIVTAIQGGIYNSAYLSNDSDTGTGDISKVANSVTTLEPLILVPNRVLTIGRKDTTSPKNDFVYRKIKTTGTFTLVNTNGSRKTLPVLTTKSPKTIPTISNRTVKTTEEMSPLAKLVIKYKIQTTNDWVKFVTDDRYRPVSTTTTPTVDLSAANRVATSRDFVESEDLLGTNRVITSDTPPEVEILSTAPIQTTTPVVNKNVVIDGSPASAFAATYNTFSGIDMVVSVNIRLDENNTINKVIGSFQTISYSVFNDKAPVRVLGDMNPRRFVFGPRLIAGSIVMTVFDKHWMKELLGTYVKIKSATEKYFLLDELPEMNVTISMANEYGQAARLALYGVTFYKEGQIMSVNDLYTENTCEFLARNIDYMDALERAIQRNKRTDIIPIKIVAVQESGGGESRGETIAINPVPSDTPAAQTDTTVIDSDPPTKSETGGTSTAPPRTVGDSRYAAIRHKVRTKTPPYTSREGISLMVNAARNQYIEDRQKILRDSCDQDQKNLLKTYNIKEKDVMTNGKVDQKKLQKLKKKWKNSEHNGFSFEEYENEYKGIERTYSEECAAIRIDEAKVADAVKEECYSLLSDGTDTSTPTDNTDIPEQTGDTDTPETTDNTNTPASTDDTDTLVSDTSVLPTTQTPPSVIIPSNHDLTTGNTATGGDASWPPRILDHITIRVDFGDGTETQSTGKVYKVTDQYVYVTCNRPINGKLVSKVILLDINTKAKVGEYKNGKIVLDK